MEIKYNDNVKLMINITDAMVQDWKACQVEASKVRTNGKDCITCSLNAGIDDFGISVCELSTVIAELERRAKE